tara:strand:+ start:192 stop:482 length:291 start_codon:yes stop_codon:yes gene_type:complete
MNKKPFIERMKDVYYKDKYLVWFVNDGSGNIMYRFRNEEDAREKSMENSEWSIGYYWEEQVVEHWEPEVNDNGIPITYENKDELSAEDIESAGSSQ